MKEPDVIIEWTELPEIPKEPSFFDRFKSAFVRDDVEEELDGEDDPWTWTRVLYAYFDPDEELAYIGKAWSSTVGSRWDAADKDKFFAEIEQHGWVPRDIIVYVGQPQVAKGKRLTSQLLKDLESLLIAQVRPWFNTQNRRTRLGRDGMVVRCTGDWPMHLKTLIDD